MPEIENEQAQLPLAGPGYRLKQAREAAGLSRADIAARTRISERLIANIEDDDFAALPSRAYATGFARSYARAVGLDENDILNHVRRELGMVAAQDAGMASSMEPGDPARIPTARFAWWLGFAALLVIAAGLFFWRSYYSPAATLPSILPEETQSAAPAPVAIPLPEPSMVASEAAATMAPDPAASRAPQPHVQPSAAPRARPPVVPTPAPAPLPTPSTVSN